MPIRTDRYQGIDYETAAHPTAPGFQPGFIGAFRVLGKEFPMIYGDSDSLHPILDLVWQTENEAFCHAEQAACHAIEALLHGRPQGQGLGSPHSERRTLFLGE